MNFRQSCIVAMVWELRRREDDELQTDSDVATVCLDAMLEVLEDNANLTGASSRSWERQAVAALRQPEGASATP